MQSIISDKKVNENELFTLHTSRLTFFEIFISNVAISRYYRLFDKRYSIKQENERKHVIKARTISGHFYFTSGEFIKEVPYDPDIYFGGYTEETTLSVRAFTNGYDFFRFTGFLARGA